jgi:hypothetical protein
MNETLSDFIFSTAIYLLLGLIGAVSILLWRFIRRRPLLQIKKDERIESPGMLYIGAILCGISSLGFFSSGMPYSGIFLFLVVVFFGLGIVAQKKGIL